MRRVVLVAIAALALAGCGKSAPPVALEVRSPAAVADLRGSIEEGAVGLVWTNPQRRADGARLRDLVEVRVYRTEDDGVMPPKPALLAQGKIAGYREMAAISLSSPAPAVVQGHVVRFVDREGLRAGRRYTYVVISEDGMGRISAPSNRFAIPFIEPAEAPATPTADAGDGEVRLRWSARAVSAGTVTYEVLRSSTADGPPDAIFPVPGGQTEYVDRQVENERTYHYAVRAVRQDAGTVARGAPSARVAATPGRRTPPAPPANLVATPSANSVRLAWAPSPDPSVAGYVVYRTGPTGERVRIGSVRAPATTFVDRDVAPGSYRYSVTAQDATARANESEPSNDASLTLP